MEEGIGYMEWNMGLQAFVKASPQDPPVMEVHVRHDEFPAFYCISDISHILLLQEHVEGYLVFPFGGGFLGHKIQLKDIKVKKTITSILSLH